MSAFTNLGKDESVVLQAKLHPAGLIPRTIIAAFLLLVGLVGLKDEGTGFFVFLLALIAVILLPVAFQYLSTQLVITTKKVYGKIGIIKTKTLDTPLNKVNTVSVSNGLFGKILGYGTIHITSSSGAYFFPRIKEPNLIRQTLMEQIERYEEDRIKKQAAEMAKAMQTGIHVE